MRTRFRRHRPRRGGRRLRRRLLRTLGIGRRYGPRRRRRWPIRSIAAGAVVLVGVGTATLLERQRHRAAANALAEYVRERGLPPAELAANAGWSHRTVFIGDVPTAVAPKRIAADAVDALAGGSGLDAVVLGVPSDRQPTIDRYLRTEPEDPAILFAQPATVHGPRGTARAYVEIYRRVWRLNRTLPPARRIRIIAADPPNWPPDRRLAPRVLARRHARRDAYMADLIERDVLGPSPRARILVFMDGYHGLRYGAIRYAGGPPVTVRWLASRLERPGRGEVYTMLTDAYVRPTAVGGFVAYGPTRVAAVLRSRLPATHSPLAVPIDDRFDFLGEAIHEADSPGLELDVRPPGYRLRDLADAYVFPGTPRGFEVRR